MVTVYGNGIYRGFVSVGEWKRGLTVPGGTSVPKGLNTARGKIGLRSSCPLIGQIFSPSLAKSSRPLIN